MKGPRFGLVAVIGIVSGVLYLALVNSYGGYSYLAPPWVNALGGVGLAFCAITLWAVYKRNVHGVSE